MKINKAIASDIRSFVASLYANGKKPCEKFGLSWDSLSELERNVPYVTCKQECDNYKIT